MSSQSSRSRTHLYGRPRVEVGDGRGYTAAAMTLCGLGLHDAVCSEMLSEVSCVDCQALAEKLNVILTRARRNPPPTRTSAISSSSSANVLEELYSDGTWRFFDLRRWLREVAEGEYVVTLRVRPSVRGRAK